MRRFAVLVALAAAGAMLALVVAAPASAWSLDDARANGFTVDAFDGPNCPQIHIAGHGSGYTDLGRTCDQGFQAALDAFMGQWCPCAQAATTGAPTTAATDTSPPPPPPATTELAPTVTGPACDVQCQIADLQAQIDKIRGELVQLVRILEQWPGIDPGILAQLLALQA